MTRAAPFTAVTWDIPTTNGQLEPRAAQVHVRRGAGATRTLCGRTVPKDLKPGRIPLAKVTCKGCSMQLNLYNAARVTRANTAD